MLFMRHINLKDMFFEIVDKNESTLLEIKILKPDLSEHEWKSYISPIYDLGERKRE